MSDNTELLNRAQHRNKRIDSRTRGVASVEAAVALPFFVLLFVGLNFLRAAVLKKHELSMTARTCAWLYSQSNCQVIPNGCQNLLGSPGVSNSSASQQLHDKLKGGASEAAALTAIVSKIVNDLLGPALDAAFGESFDAAPRGSVEKPKLFGGGSLEVSGQYHLACNLKQETPLDVVTDAWKIFRP